MKTASVVFSAALIMALTGAAAKADTITASLFSALPPGGDTPIIIDLDGLVTSQSALTGTGYLITFSRVDENQGVVHGTGPHAVPVAGVVGGTTPRYLTGGFGSSLTTDIAASGNYLSTGVGTITITFSTPQNALALLWGSIDVGNSLSFNDASGLVVTGTQVQNAAAGFAGSGFQGPGGSAYVLVNTTTPFTVVTATSEAISFEFAGVAAANTVHNPEPASLMLFGSGVGLISVFALRRRRNDRRARLHEE